MRRFLDSALPLLMLLAFGSSLTLLRWVPTARCRVRFRSSVRRVARVRDRLSDSTTVHIRAMTEQRGYLAIVKDACKTVGVEAAIIVVVHKRAVPNKSVPQTLRGWCGVPVANLVTEDNDEATLVRLAAQWEKQGRRLWAVAGDGLPIQKALPSVKTHKHAGGFERVLPGEDPLARPEHYMLEQLSFVLARVPFALKSLGGLGGGFAARVVCGAMALVTGLLVIGIACAIGAWFVIREAGRLAAEPPPPVFDMDEAFEWVVAHVPDVVAATLTPDDVRRILDFQLEFFQRKGVAGNGSSAHPPRRRHRGGRGNRRLHRDPIGGDGRGVPPGAGARRDRDPTRLLTGDRRRGRCRPARSGRRPARQEMIWEMNP